MVLVQNGMYENSLSRKLRLLNTKFINPWKDKNFHLWSADSWIRVDSYDVGDISMIFRGKEICIQFFEKDIITAIAIAAYIATDHYGFDENVKLIFGGKEFEIKPRPGGDEEYFDFILEKVENDINSSSKEDYFAEIILSFSDEDYVRSESQSVFFTVDADYDDFYFFIEEVNRRSGGQ